MYGAIQKAYHLVRRKRWVRERLLKDPKAAIKQVGQKLPYLDLSYKIYMHVLVHEGGRNITNKK